MLCARYPNSSKSAFGGYTAGSGFSASLGAFSYTYATSRMGLKYTNAFSIYGIAPLIALLVYAFLLPEPEGAVATAAEEEQEGIVRLPWKDKLRIIRPMFVPYMLPLATIFFVENSITQVGLPECHSADYDFTDMLVSGNLSDFTLLCANQGWIFLFVSLLPRRFSRNPGFLSTLCKPP